MSSILNGFPKISALRTRDAGGFVGGEWVPDTTDTPITVIPLQPASGKDLQFLPDGDRHYTHKKVWSTSDLEPEDILVVKGRSYKVVSIMDYEEACEGQAFSGFYRALIREVQ